MEHVVELTGMPVLMPHACAVVDPASFEGNGVVLRGLVLAQVFRAELAAGVAPPLGAVPGRGKKSGGLL